MHILDELEARGLVYQQTDKEALKQRMEKGPITLYCGFDPTADSLHIGHLLPILTLRRFQLAGHCPIALVGGATGLIGDPSGKSAERTLNSEDVVKEWAEKLRGQLERFLDFGSQTNPARMANNYDWMHAMSVIDFLRDIGKNFQINYMMAKDSVSSRLERGISFTEFSYMILQSYDFLKLNELYGCELQVGGSDQWGNITAGTELIRRTSAKVGGPETDAAEKQVFGLTVPLVTKSDGTKFGKTESGAVWLDPEKTSPYKFYQFWLNTDDRDVIKFLKYFTFVSLEEIETLEKAVMEAPEQRLAQRRLAEEMTKLIHGEAAMNRAIDISKALFKGSLSDLTSKEIEEVFSDAPSTTLQEQELSLVDLLIQTGLVSSKRQAREDITNGAIYINNMRSTDVDIMVSDLERLDGKYLVVRRGKKNYHLVKFS